MKYGLRFRTVPGVHHILKPPELRERSYYDKLLGNTMCFLRRHRIVSSVSCHYSQPNKHSNAALQLPVCGPNSASVDIASCRINLGVNFRFLLSMLASHNSGIDAVIGTIGQGCGESSVVGNTYVNITWTFFFSPLVGSTISIARRLLPFHP